MSRPEQLPLDFKHEPLQSEADFLVGEGNQLAYGRVDAFPDWPDPLTLFIGPAKSGKSHLARIFAERAGAEWVTPESLADVAHQGEAAPLIVEDVDRGAYDEHALFHLLNQSMRTGRPMLLTARDEVGTWPLATADVRSRMRRATVFTLELTSDIQLSQMFVKLFGDRQVAVDPKVVQYLVARMERSAEEAVVLVELLDKLALAKGSAITRAVAAQALERRRLARGDAGPTNKDASDDE